MMILFEGITMSFWLLLVCIIGIANGPVGLVCLYEKEVQDRVVELGYTTKEKIKRNEMISGIAIFAPVILVVPVMVYCINGAIGFVDSFWQMTFILIKTKNLRKGKHPTFHSGIKNLPKK